LILYNFEKEKRDHQIQQIHSENKRKQNLHTLFIIQQISFKNIDTYNKHLKEKEEKKRDLIFVSITSFTRQIDWV
jgi:hypothetical protein